MSRRLFRPFSTLFENRGRNFMKKTALVVTWIFTAALIAVLLSALLMNLFTLWSVNKIKNGKTVNTGYFFAIITSGSMSPTVWKNDLIVTKGSNSYEIGDIVTYVSESGSLVTHRIIEITEKGYVTQGDANNVPDGEISGQKILGKTVFVMSDAGLIVNWLSSPVGIVFLAGVFLLIWIIQRMNGGQNERTKSAANT